MFNCWNILKKDLTGIPVVALARHLQPLTIRVLSSFAVLNFKGSTQHFLSTLNTEQATFEFHAMETLLVLELCIEKEGVDVDNLFTKVSDLMKYIWPFPSLVLDKGTS